MYKQQNFALLPRIKQTRSQQPTTNKKKSLSSSHHYSQLQKKQQPPFRLPCIDNPNEQYWKKKIQKFKDQINIVQKEIDQIEVKKQKIFERIRMRNNERKQEKDELLKKYLDKEYRNLNKDYAEFQQILEQRKYQRTALYEELTKCTRQIRLPLHMRMKK